MRNKKHIDNWGYLITSKFPATIIRNILVFITVIFTSYSMSGCAGKPVVKPGVKKLDDLIDSGASVMWVGAHPDDECLVGSIFAKAGPTLGNPLFFFVLTHGDNGECCLEEGCHPDLPTVRGKEMKKISDLYKAQLQHEFHFNAPLPVKSFPKRHELAKKWIAEGDPSLKIAKAIRQFKPQVLITFCPDNGFTGHPEHQLASRFATKAVVMAADPEVETDDIPSFTVENTYYALNRYWLAVMIGKADPGPYSEVFDAQQKCIDDKKCRDLMVEFAQTHQSQAKDMGAIKKIRKMIDEVYLYRVDPWTEKKDPLEPVEP